MLYMRYTPEIQKLYTRHSTATQKFTSGDNPQRVMRSRLHVGETGMGFCKGRNISPCCTSFFVLGWREPVISGMLRYIMHAKNRIYTGYTQVIHSECFFEHVSALMNVCAYTTSLFAKEIDFVNVLQGLLKLGFDVATFLVDALVWAFGKVFVGFFPP